MTDFETAVISCAVPREIVGAYNRLPAEAKKRLSPILSDYLARYGIDGIFQRMNNRSVAQIIAEYQPSKGPKEIASGEVDGVRYHLYEAPSPRKAADSE